ncbi:MULTISPECIES: flagellin [Bacillus]|uniref:flagellin N-terminal helical domain-containing protein n=1 Tax=Bacillus TaxID=1386 RepID=UPI0030C982AA
MIINHNIAALNTLNRLNIATNAQSKSMEKLSSGLRINRAGDDAAGLAISEKMRAQIRGLDQASRNAQDGISLIQTAEGALNETHSILQRMRELAVQAANDTNTDTDRQELQKEVNQLANEITRIGNNTEFNTKKLLDGNFTGTFQIGANSGQNLSISINDMRAEALKVGTEYTVKNSGAANLLMSGTSVIAQWVSGGDASTGVAGFYTSGDSSSLSKLVFASDNKLSSGSSVEVGIKISSQSEADDAITIIDKAIEKVSAERSKLGATQNRLEHTINNLSTSSENLTAAESRIRDVDMAKEMMEQTKASILAQAAQAMLAQANQQPQGVLQLLR